MKIIMEDSKTTTINERTYLVTQRCDISKLSDKKVGTDLDALKTAEDRTRERINITYGKKDSAVTRAMGALSLMNPFKGI